MTTDELKVVFEEQAQRCREVLLQKGMEYTLTYANNTAVGEGIVTVTGKGDYADRSIFLPVAGYGSDSNLGSPNSQGYYWSSTPDSEDSHFAWHLYFNSNNFHQYIYYGRQYGLSVRPVRDAD